MQKMLIKHNITLVGKRVLELGPGDSFVSALLFLGMGASEVVLVDKFPRLDLKDFESKLNEEKKELETYLGESLDLDISQIIQSNQIALLEGDITNLKFDKDFDFVYSKSVFEHIKNASEVIHKLYAILKNDALMYHYIDFKDHFNFESPFLFYKYSDEVWNKYLTKEDILIQIGCELMISLLFL
jgi:hypothetical protein